MAERNLEALKLKLRQARGCPARSFIVGEAKRDGFVSCEGCGAFLASRTSPCHECGLRTTPLGANIAQRLSEKR